MQRFCRGIDTLNEWVQRIVKWLFIPLILIVTADVIGRYVFNRPFVWSWDINSQIFGAFAILGGGWALLKERHVRLDVLWGRLPPRKRVIIDVITFLLFLLCVAILLWQSGLATLHSVQTGERFSSYFAPPIYPLKIVVVLGVLLLLLQGVAKFIRDLLLLTQGEGRP